MIQIYNLRVPIIYCLKASVLYLESFRLLSKYSLLLPPNYRKINVNSGSKIQNSSRKSYAG